ncbi:chromate efflux transporter [Dasania marina]|uniref:chromate efflux transporter n=1 Tax=Dasania marina TaxID=471499 RepID=UPI0003753812|nr:chromate efflux transporter [Dasania marina]
MQANESLSASQGSVAEVFKTFLILGLTSFGGPVAHIAYFRKELIVRRGWVGEAQFSQLLAICQFIPGPASSQLGFALGLLRAGWLGAVAAFLAFTLPSVLLLLAFVYALPVLSGPVAELAIHGLKLLACVVVADAVLAMAKKLCSDLYRQSLALLAASVLLLLDTSWAQIVVIVAGAVAGMLFCRVTGDEVSAESGAEIRLPYGRGLGLTLFAVFLSLLFILAWAPSELGLYSLTQAFYNAGAMVFGGGHVVLPLLEESVVASGWLTSEAFLAGYGAAQAVPGPLFSFAAYLGAIIPTTYGPWLGVLTAVFFIFLPGFLLLAAALPVWQSIAHNPLAANAVAGVNAVVVGVLAAALYDPIVTSSIITGLDVVIVAVGFAQLALWRLSPLYVLLWCVLASLLPVWW